VAAQIGYCGLDRKRQPLLGSEIRACWESGGVAEGTGEAASGGAGRTRVADDRGGTSVRKLEFVEVRSENVPPGAVRPDGRAKLTDAAAGEDAALGPALVADHSAIESRWSLWGDPDS
jgi:hypothetical protein